MTECVLAAQRVILIGIAPFLSPVFVPGMLRDEISAAVKKNIRSDGREPFDGIAAWHIMSFEDLALFFSLPSRLALGQALVDYVGEMGDIFVSNNGMVPSFRNWSIYNARPSKAELPKAWARAMQLLAKHGTETLFRPSPPGTT